MILKLQKISKLRRSWRLWRLWRFFEASFRAQVEVDETNLGTTSFLWVIDFSLSVRHNFHLMGCQLSPHAVKLSPYG
jgi:hypothetical protein